jgi:pyruvate,water dikinase
MDIEWAKDGDTGELFVVQARPETVHAARSATTLRVYSPRGSCPVLAEGLAIGDAIATGHARRIERACDAAGLRPGEILVTETTDPDWEPVMKSAAAIVTERGGRTSHAAIVARELGVPAVVGAAGAMARIPPGRLLTVSCAQGEKGIVYDGALPFDVEELELASFERPRTKIMLNVGTPERALKLAMLPSDGVGLARMEFILAS